MSKVLITQDLFNNIDYDMDNLNAAKTAPATQSPGNPTALIVFANSDINAAIHHLLKSLEDPLDCKGIASVFVQESIKQDFVQKLQSQLKPYTTDVSVKYENFVKSVDTITKKLNAQVVTVAENAGVGPTLVCDFTHEHFGNQLPGVVTLHTFRTAKEAVSLVGKETVTFSYVSIWNENHAYAYELVAALKSKTFFINCHNVSMALLDESMSQGKSYVVMDKKYHYETMLHDGVQKSIVFPVGTIFV